MPNSVITKLPITTGSTKMICGNPNDVVCPRESMNNSQDDRNNAVETPTMIQ